MTSLTLTAGSHAFGDARHETTALMLAALEGLAAQWQPRTLCDMGCGSGILSLRALQLWPELRVVAADVEKSAVVATRENAQANGVRILQPEMVQRDNPHEPSRNPHPILSLKKGEGVLPVHSDGFNHSEIRALAPYDLIVMNILAEPILRLLADAEALLAEDGVLLLSGMLQWQQEPIIGAAQALGLELGHRFSQGDWVAHLWQK